MTPAEIERLIARTSQESGRCATRFRQEVVSRTPAIRPMWSPFTQGFAGKQTRHWDLLQIVKANKSRASAPKFGHDSNGNRRNLVTIL